MKALTRKSKRVTIRPITAQDYLAWRTTHLNARSKRNTWDHDPKPPSALTRQEFSAWIKTKKERIAQDKSYELGIFNTAGEFLGLVAILDVARGISQTAYLGYRMYNPHWGKGYGKEAVRLMIDLGFKELKLHRVEAGIEPRNTRSLRLARSLRMRREGVKKRAIFLRGQWVDLVMYTLTSEDVGVKFDASRLKHKPRA